MCIEHYLTVLATLLLLLYICIYIYRDRESASRFSRGAVLNTLKQQSGINILRGKGHAKIDLQTPYFAPNLSSTPSWKNSTSPIPQRIFRFHHKITIYSDSSKKPSNFSAKCVGKLTSFSTLAQSATLRIHTALNQPRTHLRSKS